MEKKEFLKQLKELLVVKGVPDSVADEQIVRIDAYLDRNGSDVVDVPVEEMAEGIINMLKPELSNGNDCDGVAEIPVSAEEEIGQAIAEDAGDGVSGSDETLPADVSSEDNVSTGDVVDGYGSADPVDDNAGEDADEDADMKIVPQTEAGKTPVIGNEYDDEDKKTVDTEDEDAVPASDDYSDDYSDEEIGKFSPVGTSNTVPGSRRKNPSVPDDDYARKDGEDGRPNKTLFWVIFFVALPFVIALALAVVAIYIGFWVLLAALMIGCVAGLIAFVTVGVLVSLVGIVYGVIQLIKGIVPIGLFEIGLGVIVGAGVLFIGILVYNLAIRFIPFAMKQLTRLLKFAYKKGKEGIAALKGVCESL